MVAKIMRAERAAIGVFTPRGDSYTVQEILIKGKRGDSYSLKFVKPTFTGAIKDMIIKHQPSIVNDTSIYPQGSLERRIISQHGIKSAMGVPLLSHNKNIGILAISSMNQLHDYTQDEVQLLQTLSNPIAMAIENRMLLEDLKNQAISLEKQTREKDILLKVSQALSRTIELDEVAKVASRVVGTALGMDRCSIILLTEDGNHLVVGGIYSKLAGREQKLIGKQYPVTIDKRWETVIKKRKVLVINDIEKSSHRGIIQEQIHKEGLKSLLATGIYFGKKLLGVLIISSLQEVRTFVPDEIKLIKAIAIQIAVAIENARLMQVVKIHTQELKDLSSQLMTAQETERKKIAQELHDQVGQMLQAMTTNLGMIKRNLHSPSHKMEATLDWLVDTERLLSETIEDIRTLTFDLRPSMLDDFGLYSTLRWYIEDYAKRSNIKVILKGKEEKYRFPIEIEVNLYRIVQEALNNVAKHANATEVNIFLFQKHSTTILSVKDNGKGFDTERFLSSPHKGTGIFNMKERVNLLGGNFEIISKPGTGTRISVKIPFTEVKNEESQIIDR
jgi:signal transduction histidine kinase